jgi:hypothetical protein
MPAWQDVVRINPTPQEPENRTQLGIELSQLVEDPPPAPPRPPGG